MKRLIGVTISALFCGVLFGTPSTAFDPARATTVFSNLAKDPDLRPPPPI
jgi:hypothetical protein